MRAIKKIGELLFPPRCIFCNRVLGTLSKCPICEPLVAAVTRTAGSAVDKTGRALDFIDTALAPFMYLEPVKSGILRFKFGERPDMAQGFADIMINELGACKTVPQFDIIVPVPSGHKEHKRRGYSVPYLLAKELSERSRIQLCADALHKPVDTKPQMKLSGERRRANLLGAFTVTDRALVQGKSILIVDDVLTTGSTLNECAKMLLFYGAQSCSSICIAIGSIASEQS